MEYIVEDRYFDIENTPEVLDHCGRTEIQEGDMSDAFAFEINKDKHSDQNIGSSFPSSPLPLKIVGNGG